MIKNLKDFRDEMVKAGFENKMSGCVYEFHKDGELKLEVKQRNRGEYGVEYYTAEYDDDWYKHWNRVTLAELQEVLYRIA